MNFYSPASQYPYKHVAKFIQGGLLGSVLSDKDILNTFCEYTGFTKKQVKKVLGNGGPPRLKLRVIQKYKDGKFRYPNGQFRYKSKNVIYLKEEIAMVYELVHDVRKHYSKRNIARLFLESTVLHETVHWARHRDPDLPSEAGGFTIFGVQFFGREAGEAFEIDAYGKDIDGFPGFRRLAREAYQNGYGATDYSLQ